MSENDNPKPSRGVRRIPQESVLYTRIVPLALIGMGALLVVILVLAVGILIGVITW
ncbi:MAG: hypothetical protein IT331_05080 [Anaerolineae bacterium]|nr:hypothetical protein [Anaerolineae bacterium]